MKLYQSVIKRLFDIVVAAIGLASLLLPLIIIAVIVKITSVGPILFRQKRVGVYGHLFTCIKFRTMYIGSEHDGSITTSADKRITSVGRVLRRFKLDELPQLWNVLIGNMSFVGPRPDVPGYADLLQGDNRRILNIRPGITGIASLAFRNEEIILAQTQNPEELNDNIIYPIKLQLNLSYLDKWSFWNDIGYMVITIFPSIADSLGISRCLGAEAFTIETLFTKVNSKEKTF